MTVYKCPSEKFRYVSAESANEQLRLLRDRAARGDKRRRERAAYECPDCGGWHLTSKPRPHERPIEDVVADDRPQRGALHPHALDEL